jgi:hypothetical protein
MQCSGQYWFDQVAFPRSLQSLFLSDPEESRQESAILGIAPTSTAWLLLLTTVKFKVIALLFGSLITVLSVRVTGTTLQGKPGLLVVAHCNCTSSGIVLLDEVGVGVGIRVAVGVGVRVGVG